MGWFEDMDDKVKKFIEENIELIESNRWDELYKKSDDLKADVGNFTKAMLDADIHPENYLSDLPIHFLRGSNISEFEIPNNIKSIGKYAFTCCYNLTSVTIGNNITSIGECSFEHCYSLTSIEIPDNVREISWHTFSDCPRLTYVNIPTSVRRIDEYAFFECKNLNISYAGTTTQWQNLAGNAFQGATYICNCIDGILKKEL